MPSEARLGLHQLPKQHLQMEPLPLVSSGSSCGTLVRVAAVHALTVRAYTLVTFTPPSPYSLPYPKYGFTMYLLFLMSSLQNSTTLDGPRHPPCQGGWRMALTTVPITT